MPIRLRDDGSTVTLDLHGADVATAENLILATARLAALRGRTALRVIHGSSTSDPLARNRTIKHTLERLLDSGGVREATGAVRLEDETLISLPLGRVSDSRKLSLGDVL